MAFSHKFSSRPTSTRWPIQTVCWEWSLAIAEMCPGIVYESCLLWDKSVPRTALGTEQRDDAVPVLGPVPWPSLVA